MGKCIVLGVLLCLFQAEQTGSIEGTVRMADGQPAACSQLLLRCVTTKWPYERQAWTDNDGRYVVAALPAGTYTIDFVYGSSSTDRLREEDAPTPDSPTGKARSVNLLLQEFRKALAPLHPHRVDLTAGATAKCDVQVPPVSAVTFRLYGDEGPIRDPELHLEMVDEHGLRVRQPELGEQIRTNRPGEVRFPMLPEGRYVPVVDVGTWTVRCGVQIVRGESTEPIPVRLGPLRVAVHVLDARGEPIPEANLELTAAPHSLDVKGYGVRGVSGHFRIPYVSEGIYDLEVALGAATSRVSGILVDPQSPPPEIEIRLPPVGAVRVLLVDPQGHPRVAWKERSEIIGRRTVDGLPAGGSTKDRWEGPLTPEEWSEVLFEGLTEGPWRFGVFDPSTSSLFRGQTVEVEVKAFETTDVTLVVED